MSNLSLAVAAREILYSNIELEDIIQAVVDEDLRVTKLQTSNYVSIPNDMEKEELEDIVKKKFIDLFESVYENSDIIIKTPTPSIIAALEDVNSYALFKVSKSISSTDENITVYYIEKTSTR